MDINDVLKFCLIGTFKYFLSNGEDIVFYRQRCEFEARKDLRR